MFHLFYLTRLKTVFELIKLKLKYVGLCEIDCIQIIIYYCDLKLNSISYRIGATRVNFFLEGGLEFYTLHRLTLIIGNN